MDKSKFTPTPDQRDAENHDKGHLRIIACPGSGKTEVIARRVANLIRKGEKASGIVAITFTEKAADELKTRIRTILDTECPQKADFGDMFIGTIHAFCLYLLKEMVPAYRSFDVLDDPKRVAFVSKGETYFSIGLQSFETYPDHREYYTIIDRFLSSVDIMFLEDIDPVKLTDERFRESFTRYRDLLQEEKYFDFPSIIYTLVKLIESDSHALDPVSDKLRHIIIDEYQDVDRLQEKLLKFISPGAVSVCVVGDDDQGIYHWRGTDPSVIREFVERYRKSYHTTETKLNVNFRSTSGIVEIAREFIGHNTKRVRKSMISNPDLERKYEKGDVQFAMFPDESSEAEFIIGRIRELYQTDYLDKVNRHCSLEYGDMAVLVRTNEWASKIVSRLAEADIPVVATSGLSIFQSPEVILALNCISYVFDTPIYDSERKRSAVPDQTELREDYDEVFDSQHFTMNSSGSFIQDLNRIRHQISVLKADPKKDYLPDLGLQGIYHRILSAMGAERFEFGDRYNYNFACLSQAISDYELVWTRLRAKEIKHFFSFIGAYGKHEYAETRFQDPGSINAVKVMTVHKAKGLEFPVVFIPYFIEKKSPNPKKNYVDSGLYSVSSYGGDTEDERRLYYTAITRSEKYLFLSGSTSLEGKKNRRVPHHFLSEIPEEFPAGATTLVKPRSGYPSRMRTEGTYNTSYSELVSYSRCPNDFLLRNVYGYNAGVPMAFGYGTNVHNALNLIHKEYIRSGKVPSDAEIGNLIDSIFKMRYAPEKIAPRFRDAAIRVVKQYVQTNQKDFSRILETEKRFEFVLGKALITGQIDLLKKVDKDGGLREVEIIDFKTDRKEENSTDNDGGDENLYETDYDRQLRYYAIACLESLDLHPKKAVVHHLDNGKIDVVDISPPKLKEIKTEIGTTVDSILSRNFQSQPEKEKCKQCDYKFLCNHKGFSAG